MNVAVKEEDKLDEFLESNKKSHFLQSPEWARVKSNWEHEMIVVKDKNGEIEGTMSILLRKVPVLNRYIMYAPRGFVCDYHNKDILKRLTEEANKIAKKYKAFIFRLDPDIPKGDEEFEKIIKEIGYKQKNLKSTRQRIQPKIISRITLTGKTEDELLASFSQKHRYNVRLAKRKGVTIREGTREDLPKFYEIMKVTESRDNFYVRPLSYFEKIWDEMGPKHVKVLFAEYEGEPISAVFPIKYGNKVWYLYGGSSNKHRNLMPNYLLQFEMMKWGIETGCDMYDFRGVSGIAGENHPQHGIYIFKKGFNGDIIELVDEMQIVYNPFINTVFNIMEAVYKDLAEIKDKFKRILYIKKSKN
ncbi:MAG: peptidoglycan bridge formation glycyltransferase FemA/FemB family protein [Clostridia bacterium]|nr:peptidoglycan bridge formation glycyltransferase FemA/FemB family protein [Clostridia bacterium]